MGTKLTTTLKEKMWKVINAQGDAEQMLPETSADQVTVTSTKVAAKDVAGAIDELADIAATGGVTGIKGSAETEYRKGNVTVSPENLGITVVNNTLDKNKRVAYADEAGKVTNALTLSAHSGAATTKTTVFDGSAAKTVDFSADDFTAADVTGGVKISLVNKGYVNKTYVDTELDKKLDKAGGTVTGDLAVNGGVTIGGDLTVNGTTTVIDSTTLAVKDKLIEVASGNTVKLTTPAGLVAPKYDGTNSGALVFDGDGIASVGDVVLSADGNIDVTKSNLQPLATRTGLVDGNLVKYDGTNKTLVDTGKTVDDFATATQGATADAAKAKADTNATDIANIKDGTTVVPKANHAKTADSASKATTADSATKATSADSATHATSADSATTATTATTANKVANKLTISGNSGSAASTTTYDGSAARTLSLDTTDFTSSGGDSCKVALKATGVSAGEYTAVQVDTKGRVSKGGKAFAFIEAGAAIPDDVMIGGIVFEAKA